MSKEPIKVAEIEPIKNKANKKDTLIISVGIIIILLFIIALVVSGISIYNQWFKKESPEVKTQEQDQDQDGLPEEWEKQYGLNPSNSGDALEDSDKDGLINSEEYKFKTNPKDSDTDKDGYSDGQEVVNGFNPNGSGKLETESITQKTFQALKERKVQGNWQGMLNADQFSVSNVLLNLKDDGVLTGSFVYFYKGDRVVNELSGNYSFLKTTEFTADLVSKATWRGKEEKYQIKLNGNFSGDFNEGVGKWIAATASSSSLFFLPQKEGTYIITRKAE